MNKGEIFLKTIDFRHGIMAEPIDSNFKELEGAMRQERLNVGGYGVSYGLDATIDYLNIKFKAGHVIDKQGFSYTIPETEIVCKPPSLFKYTEETDVLHDGTIFLRYCPYGEKGVSETDLNKIVVEADGTLIDVVSIREYAIKVSRDYAFRKVKVTYYYALGRIDSFVIDGDQLIVIEGVPSESPSIRPQEVGFCVCCVLINPYARKEDGVFYTQVEKVHEQDHLRNVYTNSDNELYLNGIKLSQLGFVYFERPERPTPNMLWYDRYTHKLYAYLAYEWVALDNKSMAPVLEYKLFTPEECPPDLKTFLFRKTEDMNVRFVSGQNELKIMIDQYPLFRDQFEEITYKQALEDESIRQLLPHFGYSFEEGFDIKYENIGIGFRLVEPLKTASYVEAQVMHRVVDANIHSRHQRSASFIHTGFIDLESEQTEFETNVPYRYDENQIQIMTADKNMFEHFDYEEVGTMQGELTRKVKLNRAFGYPQRIHYRITTNVYSYDHIASLLEDLIGEEE